VAKDMLEEVLDILLRLAVVVQPLLELMAQVQQVAMEELVIQVLYQVHQQCMVEAVAVVV
jgi:hypothetical protein